MPLARTPVSDEKGQFLYVLADRDCLFVIARDPFGCAGVAYLGHRSGAVAAPPARVGRFLVVGDNDSVRDSRWRILPDRTRMGPVSAPYRPPVPRRVVDGPEFGRRGALGDERPWQRGGVCRGDL